MKDTLLDSRYRLLASIGSGGEATVFRAHDETGEKEVAVRFGLRPSASTMPDPLPAFHDNWVQLLDSGLDPQHGAYHVFELLEGETLHQTVRHAALTPEAWLLFVSQALDAVEALHHAGWIHGDLNADNFIRTPLRWKLLELPFLRFTPEAGRTSLFGSIHTLAPEQLDGAQPDARSDLYALGCLFYYAASGSYPHSGATSQEITVNRLRFSPTPLLQIAPQLPASSSAWTMSLLSREPQNRFPTLSTARQMLKVA